MINWLFNLLPGFYTKILGGGREELSFLNTLIINVWEAHDNTTGPREKGYLTEVSAINLSIQGNKNSNRTPCREWSLPFCILTMGLKKNLWLVRSHIHIDTHTHTHTHKGFFILVKLQSRNDVPNLIVLHQIPELNNICNDNRLQFSIEKGTGP